MRIVVNMFKDSEKTARESIYQKKEKFENSTQYYMTDIWHWELTSQIKNLKFCWLYVKHK